MYMLLIRVLRVQLASFFILQFSTTSRICNEVLVDVKSQFPSDFFSRKYNFEIKGAYSMHNGTEQHVLGPFKQRFRGDITLTTKANPENLKHYRLCKSYYFREDVK